MRISGALFLVVLISVGFMLYLTARDATSSLDAVAAVATDLREEGVTGIDHVDDLKTFAATAAAWADAAPSPSTELRIAVALRKAAGELRSQALSPSTVHLMRARRYLGVAEDALEFAAMGGGGPGPGLATDAVRDRLENLEQAHQEHYQELDEELNQPSSASSETPDGERP